MLVLQASVPELSVGDPAPNAVFNRADGTLLSLASLKGHIIVLEFTSLNCPPCREIAPLLENLADKYRDVVFLTVSQDPPDILPKLAALRRKDARTELLQNVYSSDRWKMAKWQFGDLGVPNMFVIGRNGLMASRYIQGGAKVMRRLESRIAWARTK